MTKAALYCNLPDDILKIAELENSGTSVKITHSLHSLCSDNETGNRPTFTSARTHTKTITKSYHLVKGKLGTIANGIQSRKEGIRSM